ncbi:MAG: PIN domain-containing protein [Dehalococcoidia bacterium]|nr:PIN domain-containing protein [Dehalococcoidia bacterium]
MKKKLYLDTSVISHLYAPDKPDWMAITLQLWEQIQAEEFDIVLSEIVFSELRKCREPKLSYVMSFLEKIPYTMVEPDDRTIEIAKKFIGFGVLTERDFNDCRHIASALMAGCDIIVSWNLNHMVNVKTIDGARAIAALEGFRDVLIYAPYVLIRRDFNDEYYSRT